MNNNPPLSLADRLRQARSQQFVGRATEIDLFRTAIQSDSPDFFVLYIHGPGGVGKTSLLHEMRQVCRQTNRPTIHLDGRHIDPNPESFLTAFRQTLGIAESTPPAGLLPPHPHGHVFFLDTYERLLTLDGWLRETFLPQLPGNIILIIASRHPPSLMWRTDPGWQTLLKTISLRNLDPDESKTYLAQCAIPAEQHEAVLSFTHGYPLALSLIADMFAHDSTLRFQPETEPDMIKRLLDRLVQHVPTPYHRTALEATALTRLMTEPLLASMIKQENAHPLFEWLRSLSFVEYGPTGLFLHDLARETLSADLRWRNPDHYKELHDHARTYYADRIQQTQGHDQQATLIDYIFLHRDNPILQPFFSQVQAGSSLATFLTDVARESDWPKLIALVEQHEGAESAQLAAYWFKHQPGRVTVFRNTHNKIAGFMFLLALEQTTPDQRAHDPAVKAAWNYLTEHAPLRPGEKATHFRYWMAAQEYQTFSAITALIGVNAIRHYLTTSNLAYSFFPCANPNQWIIVLRYADLHRRTEADYTLNNQTYGVFAHDWRVVPPAAWLDLLASRELAIAPQTISRPKIIEPLLVLSKSEFTQAVRHALNNLNTPNQLLTNPLLRSRITLDPIGTDSNDTQRIETLQQRLIETIETLQSTPRDLKFYRALYHTYVQAAPTQAAAAELLDLPIGTFRRHLKRGIDTTTHILWQQEIGTL